MHSQPHIKSQRIYVNVRMFIQLGYIIGDIKSTYLYFIIFYILFKDLY